MITPNLASRPFLNTRPVWLIAIAAGILAVILVAANLRLYLVTNRSVDDELARYDELELQSGDLESAVRGDMEVLKGVPWRSLRARVDATNLVLREHAFSWLRLLDDIERVMPYDVRLTKIVPSVTSSGVIISFDVVALNRDAMLDFLDNLVADPRFFDPTPASEQTPEESTAGIYVLAMRVDYKPLEDEL